MIPIAYRGFGLKKTGQDGLSERDLGKDDWAAFFNNTSQHQISFN